MGSYLQHHHGVMILIKHFTPEAASRAQDSKWDPNLGRAVSNMDDQLDSFLDENEKWMAPPTTTTTTTNTEPPATQPNKPGLFTHVAPNDDGSLSTFGNHTDHALPTAPPPSTSVVSPPSRSIGFARNVNHEINLEALSDDEHTISFLTSKISLLDSGLKTIQDFEKNLDSKIASSMDKYFEKRFNGGSSPGLGAPAQSSRNTPDLHDREGAGR